MRYSRSLLIIGAWLITLIAGAAEISRPPFSVDWPADGNYRIGFQEDYWLLNPKITVTDAQHRLVYWAPSNYTPPAGTLMNPMGGDRTAGNKVDADVLPGDVLQLRSRAAGIINIWGHGRFSSSALTMELHLEPATGLACRYQFELSAPDKDWQWRQEGKSRPVSTSIRLSSITGGELVSGDFRLVLQGGKEERFDLSVVLDDGKLTVIIDSARPLFLSLTFGNCKS